MDSVSAFLRGEAARAAGARSMVFDWNRAAKLIRERQPVEAGAGLAGDWEWTGGAIYRDGKPLTREESYTYLASIWAEPLLDLDGEKIACWIDQSDSPGWIAETSWPPSALAILAGEEPRS